LSLVDDDGMTISQLGRGALAVTYITAGGTDVRGGLPHQFVPGRGDMFKPDGTLVASGFELAVFCR
jgi:hypothetical protein